MNKTSISWTDFTSSPIKPVGKGWMCAKVSQGCAHCYSEALNMRYGNKKSFNMVNLHNTEFRVDEDEIKRIKKAPSGSKIFLQDMTDLFNENIPTSFINEVFATIRSRPDVIFQILTKRPEEIHHRIPNLHQIPGNVWLGVSIEMRTYLGRMYDLMSTGWKYGKSEGHHGIKFVSFEPLLGDIGTVKFDFSLSEPISWIIIGGESGPHHRPMQIEWARSLVKQAKEQGVAVWMKQLGGSRPGGELEDFPADLRIREFPNQLEETVH